MAIERLTDEPAPWWVRREHLARYRFCAEYADEKIVIDCSCGEGDGSQIIARAGARTVLGLDVAAEAVIRARSRYGGVARFSVASASRLPLAKRSVDLYVCLETIEHVEDDTAMLDEARDVIRPDGLFICSTPNRTVTNPGTTTRHKPFNPFHVREYSQPELLALLTGRFGAVQLYGQNLTHARAVSLLERLALVSPRLARWSRQALKLAIVLTRSAEYHSARALRHGEVCEYLVAVCSRPRVASAEAE